MEKKVVGLYEHELDGLLEIVHILGEYKPGDFFHCLTIDGKHYNNLVLSKLIR